jgi:hypothetical protein
VKNKGYAASSNAALPEFAPRGWRRWSRLLQNLVAILWPSFLAAMVASGIFFSHVDPIDLDDISTPMANFSRLGGYTIGFFFFWGAAAISSALSVLLIRTSRRRDGSRRGGHN